MPVARTSNLPDPYRPDGRQTEPILPFQVIAELHAATRHLPVASRLPGPVTEEARRIPPDRPVSPRFRVAMLDILSRVSGRTGAPSRTMIELSISGQAGAGFPFNESRLVRHNMEQHGYPDYRDPNVQAAMMQATAVGLVQSGLVPARSRWLEGGAGLGYLTHCLQDHCSVAIALDPQRPDDDLLAAMPNLHFVASTIEQFAAAHPDARFDVVFVGHFSPDTTSAADWNSSTESFFGAASRLTADDGKFIVGVGSINPYYATPGNPTHLEPPLRRHFGRVDQMLATAFPTQYAADGSFGGMSCLLVASGPLRRPAG